MSVEINSSYYNYYNVKGRYSPETPQTPSWKKLYEVVDDRVKSNNENPESGIYKAHCKLEETYYHSSVSNRDMKRGGLMGQIITAINPGCLIKGLNLRYQICNLNMKGFHLTAPSFSRNDPGATRGHH